MGKMRSCLECGTRYLANSKGRATLYCGDTCRNRAISIQTSGSIYGLTAEQVREIRRVEACMICESTDSGFESGIFAIDHCHDTDVVRGALCQSCNFLLGNARDSVDILLAAIKYLTKNHRGEPWNKGPSRVDVLRERKDTRLAGRIQRAEKELIESEQRIKELEAILSAVEEDIYVVARRRARDADAVDKFIAACMLPCPSDSPPVPVSDIRKAWAKWAGGAPCPVASMADALRKLGGTQRRSAKGRYWVGITMSSVEDDLESRPEPVFQPTTESNAGTEDDAGPAHA
ncbi:endonuclease domain-containing protein [Streptomyces sp. ST2-7A]|uniref:endonuclease domain-containing protein n=1 Tax=Streptomyces sp. ST2-7A TaxID=2907214 RepID=UPI0035ABCEDA